MRTHTPVWHAHLELRRHCPDCSISNIIGVSACVEPEYQNLCVKSNFSDEFMMTNEHMVPDLKAQGLWDEVMIADPKYFDGSLARIDRASAEPKSLYTTAFEIDPKWLVEAASRRLKWIDQAQSLNIYMAGASGRMLDETYRLVWLRGLKTTCYLRSPGATHAEKSTTRSGELNVVANCSELMIVTEAKFCSIDNPGCESCGGFKSEVQRSYDASVAAS